MKKIKLTQHKYALVDDEDFERINQHKWCADRHGNGWRAIGKIKKTNGKWATQYMHRLIMNTPKGMDTDHRNHDGLDNQRCNLRICTHTENTHNRKSQQGISKYKGVSWHKRDEKWKAEIRANGKHVYLGLHINEISAALAYDEKAKELFGDFAYLNFR